MWPLSLHLFPFLHNNWRLLTLPRLHLSHYCGRRQECMFCCVNSLPVEWVGQDQHKLHQVMQSVHAVRKGRSGEQYPLVSAALKSTQAVSWNFVHFYPGTVITVGLNTPALPAVFTSQITWKIKNSKGKSGYTRLSEERKLFNLVSLWLFNLVSLF